MPKQFSSTFRTAAFISMIAVVASTVFGVSAFVTNKNNEQVTPQVASVASAVVSEQPAVLSEKTEVQSGYVVSVTNVSTTASHTLIDLTVTNTSANTLQLSPGLQFVLVTDAGAKIAQQDASVVKTPYVGGPIAAGASSSGTLAFAREAGKQYELYFYPTVGESQYIVVPLIVAEASVGTNQAAATSSKKTENNSQESEQEENDD